LRAACTAAQTATAEMASAKADPKNQAEERVEDGSEEDEEEVSSEDSDVGEGAWDVAGARHLLLAMHAPRVFHSCVHLTVLVVMIKAHAHGCAFGHTGMAEGLRTDTDEQPPAPCSHTSEGAPAFAKPGACFLRHSDCRMKLSSFSFSLHRGRPWQAEPF